MKSRLYAEKVINYMHETEKTTYLLSVNSSGCHQYVITTNFSMHNSVSATNETAETNSNKYGIDKTKFKFRTDLRSYNTTTEVS